MATSNILHSGTPGARYLRGISLASPLEEAERGQACTLVYTSSEGMSAVWKQV